MGTKMRKEMNMINKHQKSQTLPPSPTHSFSSSSSSDFEFTISLSPRKSSINSLCRPADELFYKGQLLPLHLSPRLSMVRTLLLPSSTSSSSCSSDTTASRDSTGSSSNESRDSFASDVLALDGQSCDSSRPSSVAPEDNSNSDESFKRPLNHHHNNSNNDVASKKKYFSLSRFSSVFKKEPKVQKDIINISTNNVPDHHHHHNNPVGPASNNPAKPKRMVSTTAKEVIRKYLKKVKPLYEKLSQKQKVGGGDLLVTTTQTTSAPKGIEKCATMTSHNINSKGRGGSGGGGINSHGLISHSFSGNLRYPRRRGCISSCPSSMRSSPSHSGVLSRTGTSGGTSSATTSYGGDRPSMEELQSAIQGAIAHCKNSLVVQSKSSTMVSIQ